MSCLRGLGLAAALAFVVAGPGAADAAVITQSTDFSVFRLATGTLHDSEFFFSGLDAGSNPQSFDPFDPTLGTLTAVQVSLDSTVNYEAGVAILAGPNTARAAAFLLAEGNTVGVEFEGTTLGDRFFSFEEQPFGCAAVGESCIAVLDTTYDFDLMTSIADLVTFAESGPVTLGLPTDLSFLGFYLVEDGVPPVLVSASSLDWNGTLSLTYVYDPVAGGVVPEPATWGLMLLGFLGTGAALRAAPRRAAAAKAAPPRTGP